MRLPRKGLSSACITDAPSSAPTRQQDSNLRVKKRARLAATTTLVAIVAVWSWWNSIDATLAIPWAFILGSLVVIGATALIVGYLHFERLGGLNEKDAYWVLIPFCLAFSGVFLNLLLKATAVRSMLMFVDASLWFRVDAFLLLYRVLETADRRLRRRHADLWIAWKKSGRTRQLARGGLVAVVLTSAAGIAFVYDGYSVLNTPLPFNGYYYFQSAGPVYANYSAPVRNMTLLVNITHSTSKEEFVVGEFIWTEVILTAVDVGPNVTTPYLRSITFPSDDQWGFSYYRSYSGPDYRSGDRLNAQARRFFPEPGELRVVQTWTVQTESRNETIPIFLNLTIHDRAAIEAFERERELYTQIYIEYTVLLRQEGYNLILIGISLIFGAALVPALVDLLQRAFPEKGKTKPYTSATSLSGRGEGRPKRR